MESLLQQEIMEQPAAVQRLIDSEQSDVIRTVAEMRGKFQYILITARGTSDNAARYAHYLFQIVNHLPVALATPSVFSKYKRLTLSCYSFLNYCPI